jgi:hypothetical protein
VARRWVAAALERLGARDRSGGAAEDSRTVEVGDGMAVVYVRARTVVPGTTAEVAERYVGIRGTPSRVVRDVARERLTRDQVEAGEEPWFPDVAARLDLEGTGP